jgi:flagella basal body P-ring formation protein FlgA
VFVCEAPLPGKSRVLSGSYVRTQLAAAGLGDVPVPPRLTLVREGVAIDHEIGRQAVSTYIREIAPWPAERYRVEVVRDPSPLTVEPGALTARLIQPPKGNLAGVRTYRVEYCQNGTPVAQASFIVAIHVTAEVYVAAHAMQRGVVVAETDLLTKELDLAAVRGTPETDRRKLVGARLARPLNEGQLFTVDSLEPVPLVRRGDAVMLVASRGDLVVTAFGLAREDGAIGKIIRLENVQSKKIVHGRVESANTVTVLF